MTPLLRDALICLCVAVATQFLLIGPLLAFMILTGGAIFAVPVLGFVLLGALALDLVMVRRSTTRGWPFSAAALGLGINVAFNAITSYGTAQ
ncbi:hypothetical protein [Jannaschia sp. CCS1]|uniref:hypothetical protein n=1 Tax=Jannaschia sp. (strain CCS1) TaxID=290400 RepID=UPI000053C3D9|nr:hypothetical protein [Jannaschia sp. CCS1]ABD53849.1 hypothetical protein Jann_0932 [Jannaschia sp. CCS1]